MFSPKATRQVISGSGENLQRRKKKKIEIVFYWSAANIYSYAIYNADFAEILYAGSA